MMDNNHHIRVRDLPADEKPREKMMRFGPKVLSDSELIAVIIGSGTLSHSAIDISRALLKAFDEDLNAFFEVGIEELIRNPELKGIGKANACKIKAAIELGRRARRGKLTYPIGTSPQEVAGYLMEEMAEYKQEHFKVLLLDSKLKIYKEEEVSIGTVNASLVHPREVFCKAIRQHAVSVILVHNHPSGDPYPSVEDQVITQRLKEAGELLGITVIDHIIIGESDYTSFQELGMM